MANRRILWLMKTKQKDKQTSTLLEKKVKVEMESRIAAEKQLAELQSRKLEEAPASPHGGLLSASRYKAALLQLPRYCSCIGDPSTS